jgi:hypothetical protein
MLTKYPLTERKRTAQTTEKFHPEKSFGIKNISGTAVEVNSRE